MFQKLLNVLGHFLKVKCQCDIMVWSQNTMFLKTNYFKTLVLKKSKRKKKQKAYFWCCFRKVLLRLNFPNDPHIYMLQSTQYIIQLVVEKGSNFAVLFYFFLIEVQGLFFFSCTAETTWHRNWTPLMF